MEGLINGSIRVGLKGFGAMTKEKYAAMLGKIKSDLAYQDKARKAMGLPPSDIVQIAVTTDNPPSGSVHIRTPFGLGYILNCKQTINGKWQTCCNVKRIRVNKKLKEMGV